MPLVSRPAIIVPGIEGSALQNAYALSPAATWSALTVAETTFVAPDFDSLALSDNAKADRGNHVITRAAQLIEIAYSKLVAGLQGRNDAPAFLFPYDWRYSNSRSAIDLVSFVERLRAKSISTLPAWDKKFDFVCHSMGGLIFRAFLAAWMKVHPDEPPPVDHAVFIATPHRGSLNAARTLITGDDPLFGGRKEMRKLARTFPSVYELLPMFGNGVMRVERASTGQELDLFNENNWQLNTTPKIPAPGGFDVEQRHLDEAKDFLSNLPMPWDARFDIPPNKMLVVFGSKPNSTLQAVKVGAATENWYDFANAINGTGDDVVPEGSARLPGVAAVAIHPQDIGWCSPLQRLYAEVDLHAFLPALDEVQTIVARFLQDDTQGSKILPLNMSRAASRFIPG